MKKLTKNKKQWLRDNLMANYWARVCLGIKYKDLNYWDGVKEEYLGFWNNQYNHTEEEMNYLRSLEWEPLTFYKFSRIKKRT